METRYCEYCGNEVVVDAVICPRCGKQIAEFKYKDDDFNSRIIINNNVNTFGGNIAQKECDKWVSFLLCLFLGILGGHKFYEGKTGLGILYIFTGGLACIGVIIDLITILCQPNPYYV